MKTQQRLDAVRSLAELAPWDGPLSSVPMIAARLLATPIALVTLLGDDETKVVAQWGTNSNESALGFGLCQTCVEGDDVLIIEDATDDNRVRDKGVIVGPAGARAYAGVALHVQAVAIGALCVLDRRPRPLLDEDVTLLRSLGRLVDAHLDLHARLSLSQAALVSELAQREVREDYLRGLKRELAHRSKNILAVVQSIAGQTLTGSPSALEPLLSRIAGLGRTHDLIIDVDSAGVPVLQLVDSHLRPFVVNASQLIVAGPQVALTASAAQHIGLSLHELASNAIKYGALSERRGRVELRWSLKREETEQILHVKWTERAGPRVSSPSRRGFGCIVLERVTPQSLDGEAELEFSAEGVRWHMTCPADNAVLGLAL